MVISLVACTGEKPNESTAPETTEAESTTVEETEAPDRFAVATPMEAPVYTFDHTPTTDELREMVVKAMEDELSIQWYVDTDFKYNKTGAASGKDYIFKQYTHYAGMPYTNAQTTTWGMLEYVSKSGKLNKELLLADSQQASLGDAVNKTIGNTCSGSTCWALFSVCNSISGPMVAYSLVQQYGFIPVGPYTYDASITTLSSISTTQICEDNGRDVMYESYSKALRGDLMVVELREPGKEHSTMVIENKVVRNADGSLNPQESYIVIQDQHTGLFDDKDANGQSIQYIGHTGVNAVKHSYEGWFNESYIPMTTAELLGTKEYVKSTLEMKKEINTFEDLRDNRAVTNYPQVLWKAVAVDNGKETLVAHELLNRDCVKDKSAFSYKSLPLYQKVKKANVASGTKIEIRVTVSTGEVYTVGSFTMD